MTRLLTALPGPIWTDDGINEPFFPDFRHTSEPGNGWGDKAQWGGTALYGWYFSGCGTGWGVGGNIYGSDHEEKKDGDGQGDGRRYEETGDGFE